MAVKRLAFRTAYRAASTASTSAPPSGKGKTAYIPPPSLSEILKGDSPQSALKLDWNENTLPPPKPIFDAITAFITSSPHTLNWYPSSGGASLKPALAKLTGVSEDHFVVTSGSDDGLKLIVDTFLAAGETILIPQPTYTQIYTFLPSVGGRSVNLEMPDPFVNDEAVLRSAIEAHTPKLVYLITPNNPTGTEWSPEQLAGLCKDYPSSLFVVDEAYFEFGSYDALQAMVKMKNAVISRTFSKCYGLAGLRCGYIAAHPSVLESLLLLYNYKSVNQIAQVGACAALAEQDYYQNYVKEVVATRESLLAWSKSLGIPAAGGGGNFICVKVPAGVTVKDVVKKFAEEHQIWVRDIDGRFPGYFRVTVGTATQMERFKIALAGVYKLS